jgi:hypothetical protein
MNLRFLCANHHQWLIAETSRAEAHWLEWIETGSNYYEQGLLEEAIPYFGCAFEIADHLLTDRWPCIDTAVSRFTLSSICLSQCYGLLGENETRNYLVVQASRRLAKELPTPGEYPHIAECMQSLYWSELNNELNHYCASIGVSNPLVKRKQFVH